MMELNVENYLPHRRTMKLIDNIVHLDENSAHSQVMINPDATFFQHDTQGIPHWVGIEYMAQTIAIFAGKQHDEKVKPKIGFLLSVRKYQATVAQFNLDQVLDINIEKQFLEDNVGVFHCEIFCGEQCLASARLNTLQPSDEQLKKLTG